ncbi:MAG: ParB/RepB/Spo0J family partition protein [Tepidiformaceae bacterium]
MSSEQQMSESQGNQRNNPRRLGRGLDALLGTGGKQEVSEQEIGVDVTDEAEKSSLNSSNTAQIAIDKIIRNPEQPRTVFQENLLEELTESIRQHGVIQPIIVSQGPSDGYVLIAGERRLQAAKRAGLTDVPVVIRESTNVELLELALVENLQRSDLNSLEEASAFQRLIDEYGLTQEDVARRIGRSRSSVGNTMRLLNLEMEIRASLVSGEISEGHARALLGMPPGQERLSLWREVVRKRLNVREIEREVRKFLRPAKVQSDALKIEDVNMREAELKLLENRLRRGLGTRVNVTDGHQGGARILIEVFDPDELDNLIIRLLGES